MSNIVQKAIEFAISTAKNDKHGYSQGSRWGNPDYDCSALVISAWEQAGVKVKTAGATYTGNMKAVFLKCGFVDVANKVNLSTGAGLIPGDVLLKEGKHTAMYIGNSQIVHASINEKGTITGGKPGDQTGKEICVRSYYNYPWNSVLRYESAKYYIKNDVKYPTISKGSKNAAYVKLLQTELNNAGFNCGAVDGIYGVKTDKAARDYQKACGLVVDGIVGPKTWAALLNIHIVELNPVSLKASLVKGVSSNLTKLFPSFINANFFSGTKTIGWLASEGKIISERDNHKKWFGLYDKPKGTFIVFKDGSVEVGFKTDREMDAVRDKIYFCCQGFNLMPLDLAKEGFSMAEVGRVCNSVMMGWNGSKALIVVRPGTDAYRAVRTMKELGCKSAIRLDSGGSANLFIGGKGIFKTNRALTNIVYW